MHAGYVQCMQCARHTSKVHVSFFITILLFLTQFLYDYRQMNLFGFSIEERVIGIPSQKIAKATENKRDREREKVAFCGRKKRELNT